MIEMLTLPLRMIFLRQNQDMLDQRVSPNMTLNRAATIRLDEQWRMG